MSKEGKESRKKWKREDVKKKVMEYLALTENEEETTKYKIQKALGIPLSTLLQAMKELEKEGLIEYEIGKRDSHICKLTVKGLIYGVMNKILDIDIATDYFIYLLEGKGITLNELARELKVPTDILLILIKMALIYYGIQLRDLEQREGFKEIHSYLLQESELLDKEMLIKLLETYNKMVFEKMIHSPWFQVILMEYGLSKDEIERFKEYVFKKDDIERTYLFDVEESKWFTRLGKFGMFRKWLVVGCIAVCVEFHLDVDKLIERTTDSNIDLKDFFDTRIVGVKKVKEEDLCPLDGFCDYDNISNLRDVVSCEKFKKLVQLQKEGEWVIVI